MSSSNASWRKQFIDIVEILASSADDQNGYIRRLDVVVDELALEFESLFIPDKLGMNEVQTGYADTINQLFEEMTTAPNVGQWSPTGLETDSRWETVRVAARELLDSLREPGHAARNG
ncbi:hypothetical protein [Mycobacteroides chelonae]|uniref:hypothetical protein n=1 Tax=Mycobacteroides chelonae TaxID=1774 RepID=UPI0018B0B008|nr:hypothetical protein [Mycobacteroides chelonae]MBF9316615.1 hypothetical protein [Mycobacteroides chelonae]